MTTPQTFDMNSLDQLSCDFEVLKSLISVAIDQIPSDLETEAENLLHAALNQLERADDRHQAIHKALLAIRNGKGALA